jgi:hypothetical protein
VLTSAQVKALLEPLISFDVKTPVQAYTDTLPTALKDAILDHKVLVGMNTDMVMFAKGQPSKKSREMDGQMPFQEWVYGVPPEEVDFVRINGNRVIRVEIAKDGQPLAIFTRDVVSPMLEAAPPPSLRNPGETLPTNNDSTGEMRPVQFPKPHTDDVPGANPDEQSSAPPAAAPASPGQTAPPASTPAPSPSATPSQSPQPGNGTQPVPANATPSDGGKQQPPAPSNQLVSASAASAVVN